MSYRMPAEWEPHERTLMAWPVHPSWGKHLELARETYAELANTIVGATPESIGAQAWRGQATARDHRPESLTRRAIRTAGRSSRASTLTLPVSKSAPADRHRAIGVPGRWSREPHD